MQVAAGTSEKIIARSFLVLFLRPQLIPPVLKPAGVVTPPIFITFMSLLLVFKWLIQISL
jgi:hypothetical protein